MPTYELELDAHFHQFYLMDAEIAPSIPEDVTDADVAAGFKVADNIVVVYTRSDSAVPVSVSLRREPPSDERVHGSRVIDVSLALPSGALRIAGCVDYLPDCLRIETVPGEYRVRVYCGTAGDGERYLVCLWPVPTATPTVNEA